MTKVAKTHKEIVLKEGARTLVERRKNKKGWW